MPTYVLNKGQEANSIGALMAVRTDDWFVPAFRELGGMLVRGVTLKQYYLYWYGNEWANHMPVDTYHMMPISVPVGSQMLHAVGLAWAERYKGTDRIAITFMGEGASSEGDFHEACNLAGVWKAGVIFYAQNNHWSISLPWSKQSAIEDACREGIRVRVRRRAGGRQRHLRRLRGGDDGRGASARRAAAPPSSKGLPTASAHTPRLTIPRSTAPTQRSRRGHQRILSSAWSAT